MVGLISLIQRLRLFRQGRDHDVHTTDPGLLARHSKIGPLTTRHFTYPAIRLAYIPHSKVAKLPADLPLLVFVHGLGGSAAQFAPLATSLSSAASCLLIDLPGCGRSTRAPRDPAAYTLSAFADIVSAAIDQFRLDGQKVVLIGHSLGCSINVQLASQTTTLGRDLTAKHITAGMIAICPRAEAISEKQRKQLQRIKYIPTILFDAFRAWDRRGGLNSASITRFVGKGADIETRKLQQRYNAQSQSATVLTFLGSLGRDDAPWPGESVWKGVNVPLFLIAAESDTAVDPKSIDHILNWLMQAHGDSTADSKYTATTQQSMPAAAGDVEMEIGRIAGESAQDEPALLPHDHEDMKTISIEHETTHHAHAIKTTLFPAPASHGVMYATNTVRPLASLVQNFLASHIDSRLSPAWQLNHMSTSGKWDVKNLKKWEKVPPISGIIAGHFRAMKTMREVDDEHCPTEFVKKYGCFDERGEFRADGVGIVIDISHETPVYDPKGLEREGVHYHKFPTVSKLPPGPDEVAAFIALINRLKQDDKNIKQGAKIGVHCHYGFNRTGFFLICFMIEQLGWPVQDAVQEFKVFQILADGSHALSKLILLWTFYRNRSAEGVSFLTQALYLVVFVVRYNDIAYTFSTYLLVLKIFHLLSSALIIFLMLRVLARTRERELAWKLALWSTLACLLTAPFTLMIFNYKDEWTFAEASTTSSQDDCD
ncbi:hypothetical protein AMS68_005013 [Peltaster fructicola]|uniref:Tyrosine specific protein phosphatases domain-containing protein n=1 Tax=Peltaster fructicola TaxID=286661 RepID=A0A6H0XXT3_9PEZI|nr:hypothetical protein AMS68_005013 [Peltaster fructicola]